MVYVDSIAHVIPGALMKYVMNYVLKYKCFAELVQWNNPLVQCKVLSIKLV